MAAVGVATQTTDSRARPHASVTGFTQHVLGRRRHRKFGLITVTNTGDTLATGITNIVECAWTPVNTTDPIAVTWDAAGLVTFTGTNGSTGHLHVWC